jgi:hypothetical protein
MRQIVLFLPIALFCGSVYGQSPYQNVQISNTGGPNEFTICINPKNTNQLYGGSNINKYWYSSDGGLTWSPTQTLVSNPYGVWGDFCIVIDTLQSWYIFHLANNPGLPWPAIDRIVCQKTTSFGGSFSNPGTYTLYNPPKLHDKEWAVVDWSRGPRGNWIYCTWTQFDVYGTSNPNDSTHIIFARSTDGGMTWTQAQRINKRGGNCADGDYTVEGAVPAAGPNGQVYVAWSGPNGVNDFKIFFDKSTDGGVTWLTNDMVIANHLGGWDLGPGTSYGIAGIQRANGMPITVCDVGNSPYRGYVYVNWVDSTSPGDRDVKFSRSTDQGTTWSTPLRVNDDPPGREQFFTWMTVDNVTGFIYIVFYDRRNYTNTQTDVYLARSTNAGQSFTNERISANPFTPSSSVFFGDYINITAHNGVVRPMWMRLVSGSLSAWTAIINFPVGVEATQNEIPLRFGLGQNYPNPFNAGTVIRYHLNVNGFVTMKIYDILGREAATLLNERKDAGSYQLHWDASGYPSGVYYYQLTVDDKYKETKKMMVVK